MIDLLIQFHTYGLVIRARDSSWTPADMFSQARLNKIKRFKQNAQPTAHNFEQIWSKWFNFAKIQFTNISAIYTVQCIKHLQYVINSVEFEK